MTLLFSLSSLVAPAFAGGGVDTASFLAYDDWAATCNSNVYRVDGYETGLVASLDYSKSNLYTVGSYEDGDLNTVLQLDFIVPTRYAAQYEGSSMEILLHNSTDAADNAGEAASACFTSCAQSAGSVCTNDSICLEGTNDVYWFVQQRSDDPCMSDVQVQLNWTDAVNSRMLKMSAPNDLNPRDNGDVVEIFFDARILLWTSFSQKHRIDGYLEWDDGTERTDDGGWAISASGNQDYANPDLWINDTRFLDYTIPFFLVFPRSVQAEFEFIVASTVTVLAVTGRTEVVNIDIHADKDVAEFGQLDVTFTTSVQFPYAVRGPREDLGQIRMNSTDPTGPRVEFVEWDDSATCYNDHPDYCTQSFTVRIFPTSEDPCKVDGTYTVQGWTKCVDTNTNQNDQQPQPCALNDLELDRSNLTNNNGYFTFDIVLPVQEWCPRIVDEVVVTPTLNLFNDPDFETYIYNQGDIIGDVDVYSNNWIYCEVVYDTSSDTGAIDESVEGDVLIDIARATKIYMDVQLAYVNWNEVGAAGSQDGQNSPQISIDTIENRFGSYLDGIPQTSDLLFEYNNEPNVMTWADLLDHDSGYAVTQNIVLDADKMQYRVLLCETHEVQSYQVYDSNVTLDDCFTNTTSLAIKFFDMRKVLDSEGETATNCGGFDRFGNLRGGSHNCIDENEIAWAFRLDERIIPMDPDIDNGEIRIWVESEVYYIGNYQLTRRRIEGGLPESRRRLQDINGPTRVQDLITSASFSIRAQRHELRSCPMHALEPEAILTLEFQMSQVKMATDFGTDAEAINWSILLGSQMEEVMRMPHTVQVVGLTKCDMTCSQVYFVEGHEISAVDRTETTVATMIVSLKFSSNELAKAGHILNIMQEALMNENSFIFRDVEAFEGNILSHMQVEGFCEDIYDDPSMQARPGNQGRHSRDEQDRQSGNDNDDNNNTTLLLAAAAGFLLALILGFIVRCYDKSGSKKNGYHGGVQRKTRDGTISTVL